MNKKPIASLEEHFGSLPDPRNGNATQHKLFDILVIAICAVICGADGWSEIELFGKRKYKWLKTFLELPKGIPSHDTFGRVFAKIKPEAFQSCFVAWVQAIESLTAGQVIAVDGKQMRGSHDGLSDKAAIYMVSAWATENELVLGQRKVAQKSNEITAIPELLQLLEIEGCIVTIDAIGTQTKIAKTILQGGADYLFSVKENQKYLYQDIQWLFEFDAQREFAQAAYDYAKTVSKGHGRLETRECWAIEDEAYLAYLRKRNKWPQLKSMARIVSTRRIGEKVEVQTRYFISSLPANAKLILKTKRSHWKIENQLHWVLDIAFREDHSRVRIGHAAENLATLRHLALNLLKKEKSAKGGIHAKRLQAAWDQDYLIAVLKS